MVLMPSASICFQPYIASRDPRTGWLSTMPFDLELLKTILSIFSIFVFTASGVAALLVEYKDKATGKITKWGGCALFGLAASFLIGTSNLLIDYTQKSREAREAGNRLREGAEKTLQIVTDISRTLNPLKDVAVEIWLTYPVVHPEFELYRQRLDEGVRALLPSLTKSDFEIVQGVSASRSDGTTITEVMFNKDSPFFPDKNKERFAYTVLSRINLDISFFKTPIDGENYDSTPKPDIIMRFEDSVDHIAVRYDLQSKQITLNGTRIPSDSYYWNSSGAIVSLLDLPGTQLIINADPNIARDPHIQVEPDITRIALKFAERREWRLSKDKLKFFRSKIYFSETTRIGHPFYEFVFPKTYQELLSEADAR